ncbi:MAG: MbcA/ParS/Xre antitoxin family protein [Nitrospiraceae bacterium]|nr:MbcA/ParS/Xre antitoxin family protein [Nitrospiraceae bacterium]
MKNKITLKDGKPDPRSREGRIALAGMVMKLFDLWELPVKDQLAFLGLSEGSRKALARYRKGEPLANHRDLLDRAGNLLSIHRSLRILYPHNREIVYKWMTTPNGDFNGHSPADIVSEEGFLGLLRVKGYLDYERER